MMAGDPAELALARIEAAIARIEAAAQQTSRGDSDLSARHEQLRNAVSQTLQQLDGLIAGQETAR